MGSKPRWTVFFLLATALISFFLPLVSLQIPILGNQSWSGYDAISRMSNLEQQLTSDTKVNPPAGRREGDPTVSQMPEMPLSVQSLQLVPIEIGIAFVSALLSFFLLIGNSPFVKTFTALGAVGAVAGLIHITVANSDLHSWMQSSIAYDAARRTDAYGVGIEKLGGLIANSVQLNPGWGMFMLAASLSISFVVIMSQTRQEAEEMPKRGGFITAGE
jgi:hypothetical protein